MLQINTRLSTYPHLGLITHYSLMCCIYHGRVIWYYWRGTRPSWAPIRRSHFCSLITLKQLSPRKSIPRMTCTLNLDRCCCFVRLLELATHEIIFKLIKTPSFASNNFIKLYLQLWWAKPTSCSSQIIYHWVTKMYSFVITWTRSIYVSKP